MTAAPGSGRRASFRRSALLYAAVLLVGAALFFALHYVGNSISYDAALERVTTELASDQPDLGHLSGLGALLRLLPPRLLGHGRRQAASRR